MLLERSGASLETAAEIVYWVNTTGLSLPYRRLLEEVVDGLGFQAQRASCPAGHDADHLKYQIMLSNAWQTPFAPAFSGISYEHNSP